MQDSNGAVYLNGQPLRLKMTRFTESHNKAEVITGTTIRTHSQPHTNHPSPDPKPFTPSECAHLLKAGQPNTLVVLHFNWGDITTFQRTGQTQAGLWLNSNFGFSSNVTSQRWRWLEAPQFLRHKQQIIGIGGAHR